MRARFYLRAFLRTLNSLHDELWFWIIRLFAPHAFNIPDRVSIELYTIFLDYIR